MNRETIYAALFTALSGAAGFTTKSRRLKHWSDTPTTAQPSLMVSQTGEQASTENTGNPTKWKLQCEIYIYAHLQANQDPGPVMNPLIDAVCNILNTPHPITGRTNLGLPNVAYCRVDGNIQIDEGTLDNQAVAIVPVVIYAT